VALVSAIIGGLISALFVFVGMQGPWGQGDVTINEAAPREAGRSVTSESGSSGVGDAAVQEVYDQDGAGVVSVEVASSEAGPGGGSGFVLDEEGHIVTNQHVVEGAESVSVRFSNGAREEAQVVGEDPSTDVALLEVEVSKGQLRPLTLGDSDAVGVGDPVIAIGNPLGLGTSVTTGIVSATGRPIDAPNGYTIDGAVQTDAAISSGNSGGPLLDAQGSVIGVTSQVASADGTGGYAQGLGFAVPVNTVKNVVEQIITKGEVAHGYIGVQMFQVGIDELLSYTSLDADELGDEYGLPANGAIISEVTPGGPADEAGIRGGESEEIDGTPVPLGDVVTEVEGEPVQDPDDVITVVNSLQPGDTMQMTVVTPGEEPRSVEVRVGTQPDEA
jgi:S1-C subfamily serine protease